MGACIPRFFGVDTADSGTTRVDKLYMFAPKKQNVKKNTSLATDVLVLFMELLM